MEKVWGVIISGAALLLAGFYMFSSWARVNIQIDGIAIFLLVLAAIGPYLPRIIRRISQIEFPGGGKISLSKEIERTAELTREAIREEARPEVKNRVEQKIRAAQVQIEIPPSERIDLIESARATEPRWALARLRMELEDKLREIFAQFPASTETTRRVSAPLLVRELQRMELISPALKDSILSIYRLTSGAIHGERVSAAEAERILELGSDVLATLDDILREIIEIRKET